MVIVSVGRSRHVEIGELTFGFDGLAVSQAVSSGTVFAVCLVSTFSWEEKEYYEAENGFHELRRHSTVGGNDCLLHLCLSLDDGGGLLRILSNLEPPHELTDPGTVDSVRHI